MASSKGVAQPRGGGSVRGFGLRQLRERLSGGVGQALQHAWVEVIRRETLCFVLAAIFTATVVVPGVLIFGNRSLPLEYLDANIVEKTVVPGERAHVRFTVNRVQKECRGRVERYFYDADGKAFFLGSTQTIYYRALQDRPRGTFERSWTVPTEAALGEGIYVAFPEFWCNGVQRFYPISAPPQKARVTVVAPR